MLAVGTIALRQEAAGAIRRSDGRRRDGAVDGLVPPRRRAQDRDPPALRRPGPSSPLRQWGSIRSSSSSGCSSRCFSWCSSTRSTCAWTGGIARDRLRATVACTLVALFALIPLLPVWPYGSSPSNVPSWFTPVPDPYRWARPSSSIRSPALSMHRPCSGRRCPDTFRMPGGFAVFRSADGRPRSPATRPLCRRSWPVPVAASRSLRRRPSAWSSKAGMRHWRQW